MVGITAGNFGDNTTSTSKEPGHHTYTRWGPKAEGFKYRITLKVDAPHCSDADTAYVYLLPTEPVAFFATSKDSACSPYWRLTLMSKPAMPIPFSGSLAMALPQPNGIPNTPTMNQVTIP